MLFIALIVIALCATYLYFTSNHDYWLKRNVKYEKPLLLFGNFVDLACLRKSLTQWATELYWRYPDEKVIGYFNGTYVELLIRDPAIIKRILINDFAYFYDRGIIDLECYIEPLLKNLFCADGDLWKLLRQRMTPAFSSGKLKAMFPIIIELTKHLQYRIAASLDKEHDGLELDARDLMGRYTTDFIGAVGFGLNCDSLKADDSAFRKLGKKIFSVGLQDAIMTSLKYIFPKLLKNVKVIGRVENDLISLVSKILKQRQYEPSNRHDFIDLLLECRKKGTIVGDSIEKVKADGTPEPATLEMTDLLIAAQVFVFFAAGFETSSSATSFTLHQLALNINKQKKVQEEIDKVLLKYNNKLCFDAIREMTYLKWCFKEAMRIFPSLGFLKRRSAKKYTIPEINVTIDERVSVLIPLQALQNDPKYFKNPDEFRPERFSSEEWDSNNNYIYLPFGDGPRACIGERLGLMQSLAGLAAVLAKFNVSLSPRTVRHPRVDPHSHIVQTLKDGLPLQFTHRNNNVRE